MNIHNPTASYSWTMRDDGDSLPVVVVVVDVLTVPAPAVATDDGGSLPAVAASEAETAAVDNGWK